MRRLALVALVLAGAAACAPVPGGRADSYPQRLSGVGTEPFWGLSVDGGNARYSTPERQEGVAFTVTRRESRGVLLLAGRMDGAPFSALVTRATCSDGMSDRVWPMKLEIEVAGEKRQGCAAAG